MPAYDHGAAAQLNQLGPGAMRVRRPDRRSPRGEDDGYWHLSATDRRRLGRWVSADGRPIEELATWLSCSCDDAWTWLAGQALMASGKLSSSDGVELVPVSELMGPAEIASLLDVGPATIRQWRRRRILPPPLCVLSGTEVWERTAIVSWADSTGRWQLEQSTTVADDVTVAF